MNNLFFPKIIVLLFLFLVGAPSFAEEISLPGIDINFDDEGKPEEVSKALQILALLTILSLAPALVIMLTAFTRIIVVLAMLRHAFGMPTTPPNTVIITLALFLTLFTMMPVIEEIEKTALNPYTEGEMTSSEAMDAAIRPLRKFMIKQTREEDLMAMIELSNTEKPKKLSDLSNTVLIPAFMLSELQTAFKIGFIIFLPFLMIDLITASVLMAMGMIMVPPLTISLPIKVLMFVLIDGWILVTQSLLSSF